MCTALVRRHDDEPNQSVPIRSHCHISPSTILVGLLALFVWTLHPTAVRAQVEPQVAPTVTSPGCAPFDLRTPDQYEGGRFNPVAEQNKPVPPGQVSFADRFVSCIDALKEAIANTTTQNDVASASNQNSTTARTRRSATQGALTPTDDPTVEDKIHDLLVKDYLAYRRIRRWTVVYQKAFTTPGCVGPACVPTRIDRDVRVKIEHAFQDLSETLEAALTKHGLNQPFSADLITAFSLQQTGAQSVSTNSPNAPSTNAGTATPNTSVTNSQGGSSTQSGAAGLVRWQSIHFYADPDRVWDIDLAGQFGFEPVLAVVQPASNGAAGSASGQNSDLMTTFQSAFEWHGSFDNNWRFADLAEVTDFFRIGQTVLNSTQTLIDNGSNSTVAIAAANNTGRAELFYEVGVNVSVYAQSLEVLHLKKGFLTPMFAFGGGYRHDNRFTQAGVLSTYNAPEARLFMRFMVDALQLTNKNQVDKPFTIGLSVDINRSARFSGTLVPSGTRILLRGDLNLFKATQSSGK